LYEDVALYFEDPDNRACLESCKTIEKNSGRIEKRVCWKMDNTAWLQERHDWPGLCSVVCVKRTTEHGGNIQQETSYYISSLDDTPRNLMDLVREHWKIEAMHWMLDVTFSEDIRHFLSENTHKTLNAMRKFALAAHKQFLSNQKKKISIKSNMLRCLLNPLALSQFLATL